MSVIREILLRRSFAMNFSKKLNLIIYRFREKGLEVFLINNDELNTENWDLPTGSHKNEIKSSASDELIELDPIVGETGEQHEAWAVEGDWHDIPSLKTMIYEDAKFLKDKMAEMEKGSFVKFKEAIKKVLPHQYKFLKELKDILTDRNSVKDI